MLALDSADELVFANNSGIRVSTVEVALDELLNAGT
jgi:hypothetical protein